MIQISAYERETVERRLSELKQQFYSLADVNRPPVQRYSQMRSLLAEIRKLRSSLAIGMPTEHRS
jgi:hypothetical protein